LRQLPLVAEQRVEIAHVPLGRVRLPRAFNAGRDRVTGHAALERRDPAEALQLDFSSFRLFADMAFRTSAVRFTEGVTTGNKGDGLFVIHRHAGESFANIAA